MEPAIADLLTALAEQQYVADAQVATALHLAIRLGRPLLLEGDAGVGKTELAKVLARALGTRLIRLQCYEGLDESRALYEWNTLKQILQIRVAEAAATQAALGALFTEEYLLERPLLASLRAVDQPPVLLIDEVDRADEEFEAFLLEMLSDFQVTVPELGTITAVHRPHVILTSNRTRELSDALRRRCLYLWLEYPDMAREEQILQIKVPGVSSDLARQIAGMMQVLRRQRLNKPPGIAESLDWAVALMALHRAHLDPEAVRSTLTCIIKERDDLRAISGPYLDALLTDLPAPGEPALAWLRLAERHAPAEDEP